MSKSAGRGAASWRVRTERLLAELPPADAEWYRRKFAAYQAAWARRGMLEIPDEVDPRLESTGAAPSWRLMAGCIERGDLLCAVLGADAAVGEQPPPGLTWRAYTEGLLVALPAVDAAWYRARFEKFTAWWAKHGVADIPDEADPHEERRGKAPSWRRLARAITSGDIMCTSLGLTDSPTQRERYRKAKEAAE